MNQPRETIQRYLDGEASAGEVELVAAWIAESAENRRLYLQEAALHRQLRYWALGRTALRFADKDRKEDRPAKRMKMLWLAAAAALMLIAGAWWTLHPKAREVLLTHASGEVTWSNESGDWRAHLRAGVVLPTGTLTIAGPDAAAELTFRDGSRVLLTGDGEIAFFDGEQKRLNCRRGTLSARVSPQPKGHPMLVRTPVAEIEVVGTIFAVEAETGSTSVMVESGKVRVRRLGENASALVNQSERVRIESVAPSARIEPSTARPSSARWTANLSAPVDDNWAGRWMPAGADLPARIVATPNFMERKDQRDIRPVVKLTFPTLEARPAIEEDAAVQMRIRGSGIERLSIFISTGTTTGQFGGNFEASVPWNTAAPDDSGWRIFSIPFRDAVPRWAERFPTPIGNCIRLLIVDARSHEAEFEIAELAIAPGGSR